MWKNSHQELPVLHHHPQWWRGPDERTHVLRAIAKISVGVPGMIEFVDVAGLVAGASKAKVSGSAIYSPTLLN
jgi:hypothetical protein